MLHLPLSLLLAAPSAFQPLYADHAEATSFLKSNLNKYEENYHPNYVLDGDPKTAWVEGKDGDGVGESITIPLSTLKSARSVRLDIWNGYQKSKNLLEANAAPAKVTIQVLGPDGRITGTTTTTLKRQMGAQRVTIPVQGGVEAVRLVIDSVTAGRTYRDTCISDIQVFVDSDVPWNARAEDAKRGALRAWAKERKTTAAYFARLPAEYPFASARFEAAPPTTLSRIEGSMYQPHADPDLAAQELVTVRPEFRTVESQLAHPFSAMLPGADRALIQRVLALDTAPDDRMPEAGVWMSFARTSTPPPLPDSLESLWRTREWLRADAVAFFEARGRKGTTRAFNDPDAPYIGGSDTVSNAYVSKREDGTIASAFIAEEFVRENRGISTTAVRSLYLFRPDGALDTVAQIQRATEAMTLVEGPMPPQFTITRLSWVDGKITAVDVVGSARAIMLGDAGLARQHWSAAAEVASVTPETP